MICLIVIFCTTIKAGLSTSPMIAANCNIGRYHHVSAGLQSLHINVHAWWALLYSSCVWQLLDTIYSFNTLHGTSHVTYSDEPYIQIVSELNIIL